MPGTILWQSGSIFGTFAAQLSGQGAQIANGACLQVSGDFYNNGVSGGPTFYANFELLASASGWGAAVQSNQPVNFFMVPSLDGSNFPNVDTANASIPTTYFRSAFITAKSGNQQDRMAIEGVPLMPVRYRLYLINNTGQTLTSGWSLFLNNYEEAYT